MLLWETNVVGQVYLIKVQLLFVGVAYYLGHIVADISLFWPSRTMFCYKKICKHDMSMEKVLLHGSKKIFQVVR